MEKFHTLFLLFFPYTGISILNDDLNITNRIDITGIAGCGKEQVVNPLAAKGNRFKCRASCKDLAVITIHIAHSAVIYVSPA